MKQKAHIFILSIFTYFLFGCGTSKLIEKKNDKTASANKIEQKDTSDMSQFILLSCNGTTGKYIIQKDRMENGKYELFGCISQKAFDGDTSAINQLVSIFPYIKSPFSGNMYPFRGEKLFPLLLDRLNDYSITIDEMANSIYPYSSRNMWRLFDMIESIEGKDKYEYMAKNVVFPSIDKYDIDSEHYRIESAKAHWHTINEAYKKGLIIYKPYGIR
jgi:hypothetical protein